MEAASGSNSPGSSSGREHRAVFLGKTLFTQVYKWVQASLMPGVTLQWISIHPESDGQFSS